MLITIQAIKLRASQTLKSNMNFKGGSKIHYDESLMVSDFVKEVNSGCFPAFELYDVPPDWKHEFDSRYSLKWIHAELNKKEERKKLNKIRGTF